MDVTSKQELTVNGMTCSHCAQMLTTVLSALSGVENVDVDVTSGRVILDVAHPLSTNALTQAVSEAGFELTAIRERAR